MPETIAYDLKDEIAAIQLDDGKVNAMSQPFFDALNAVLDRAEKDRAQAVVITGRPGVFSAGLNLKVLPTLAPEDLTQTMINFGRTIHRVFTFPIPTVAAVSGHAIAGGAMLMFACDLRLVAEGANRIQLNEVAIGLTLPTWAITIAEFAIPPRWHTEAILHARMYLPEEALERGMIQAVVRPADRLHEEALATAGQFKVLDTIAYASTKARQRAEASRRIFDLLEKEASSAELKPRGS
jgi:enoyl-CoA hydratase